VVGTAKALGLYRTPICALVAAGVPPQVHGNGVFSFGGGRGEDGDELEMPELGHGEGVNSVLVPQMIKALAGKKVIGAAAGGHHTVVRTEEGELFTFGDGGSRREAGPWRGSGGGCTEVGRGATGCLERAVRARRSQARRLERLGAQDRSCFEFTAWPIKSHRPCCPARFGWRARAEHCSALTGVVGVPHILLPLSMKLEVDCDPNRQP